MKSKNEEVNGQESKKGENEYPAPGLADIP